MLLPVPKYSDGSRHVPIPADDISSDRKSTFHSVGPDDRVYQMWLQKLGTALLDTLAPRLTPSKRYLVDPAFQSLDSSDISRVKTATLKDFPRGYRLLLNITEYSDNRQDRKDHYLVGTSIGSKIRFRSPNEFIPHLQWLVSDNTHNYANCTCKYCSKRIMDLMLSHMPQTCPSFRADELVWVPARLVPSSKDEDSLFRIRVRIGKPNRVHPIDVEEYNKETADHIDQMTELRFWPAVIIERTILCTLSDFEGNQEAEDETQNDDDRWILSYRYNVKLLNFPFPQKEKWANEETLRPFVSVPFPSLSESSGETNSEAKNLNSSNESLPLSEDSSSGAGLSQDAIREAYVAALAEAKKISGRFRIVAHAAGLLPDVSMRVKKKFGESNNMIPLASLWHGPELLINGDFLRFSKQISSNMEMKSVDLPEPYDKLSVIEAQGIVFNSSNDQVFIIGKHYFIAKTTENDLGWELKADNRPLIMLKLDDIDGRFYSDFPLLERSITINTDGKSEEDGKDDGRIQNEIQKLSPVVNSGNNTALVRAHLGGDSNHIGYPSNVSLEKQEDDDDMEEESVQPAVVVPVVMVEPKPETMEAEALESQRKRKIEDDYEKTVSKKPKEDVGIPVWTEKGKKPNEFFKTPMKRSLYTEEIKNRMISFQMSQYMDWNKRAIPLNTQEEDAIVSTTEDSQEQTVSKTEDSQEQKSSTTEEPQVQNTSIAENSQEQTVSQTEDSQVQNTSIAENSQEHTVFQTEDSQVQNTSIAENSQEQTVSQTEDSQEQKSCTTEKSQGQAVVSEDQNPVELGELKENPEAPELAKQETEVISLISPTAQENTVAH